MHACSAAGRTARFPPGPWSNPLRPRPRGRRSSPSSTSRARDRRRGRRSRRKPGRADSGGPVRPTAIRPSTTTSRSRSRATSAATSSGAHPPLPGSSLTFTCTSTRAPGAQLGDRGSTSDGRSTLCHRSTTPASERTLFDCSRPMKCTRGRSLADAGQLGQQLLGVVLADVVEPDGDGRLDHLGAEALGDGDDGDVVAAGGGDAAGGARPAGRPPRRRRPPSRLGLQPHGHGLAPEVAAAPVRPVPVVAGRARARSMPPSRRPRPGSRPRAATMSSAGAPGGRGGHAPWARSARRRSSRSAAPNS